MIQLILRKKVFYQILYTFMAIGQTTHFYCEVKVAGLYCA